MIKIYFAVATIFLCAPIKANESTHKPDSAKTPPSSIDEQVEKPSQVHKTAPSAVPPDAVPGDASADGHGASEVSTTPERIGPLRDYTPGKVEKFPAEIAGLDIISGKQLHYTPTRGRATLVFFVASWCEPCQQLMPQIKNMGKKYENIYTDVIFVFAHDTTEDARGFAKEHKLTGRMVIATHEILKSFKNPPLPSIYVGDRYNYLSNRALKITSPDITKMDEYLGKLTAF